MDKCITMQNEVTTVNPNIRKRIILEKIEQYRKISALKRITLSFKNMINNTQLDLQDNIALNYSYLFKDIDLNNYTSSMIDNANAAVDLWVGYLLNPSLGSNENPVDEEVINDNNRKISGLNELNIKLYKDYLFKIILNEVKNSGKCELITTEYDNEILRIVKYLAGINTKLSMWIEMIVDSEGIIIGSSKVSKNKTYVRNM